MRGHRCEGTDARALTLLGSSSTPSLQYTLRPVHHPSSTPSLQYTEAGTGSYTYARASAPQHPRQGTQATPTETTPHAARMQQMASMSADGGAHGAQIAQRSPDE